MSRKILFFINPISGTRSKLQLERKIIKKCYEQNVGFEMLLTAEDGNYSFLKEKIKKDKITDIVICGGDGSMNPIVASLLNTKINFGIIPLGSGNGLAFAAKIPRSVNKAFDVIFNGKASCVDAFLINDKVSCMLCGIGFDAQVAYDFSLQKKRGLTNYIRQSFKNFLSADTYPFEIEINNTFLKVDAFFICVANSNQFGNNFTIAPKASLNDGLIDIIVVKKTGKIKVLWSLVKQMKTGKLTKDAEKNFFNENILYFQADALKLKNIKLAPLHIDGDPSPTYKDFDIQIIPNAFMLIQP
ncbi:MAG TPA: YegS/Rv2252/BmrU family lipid kinase [Chitinophagaceae bacterium]|nr:YegS/Rv2252/BmrU family lipid kinase [Chitinophagaceae bacterium]